MSRNCGAARIRIAVGSGLLGLGLAAMGRTLLTDAVPLLAALGFSIVSGLGIGLAYPTASASVLSQSREPEHGFVSSAMESGEFIFVALATGLPGLVLATDRTGMLDEETIRLGLIVAYTVSVLVAGVAAFLAPRLESREDAPMVSGL